MTVRESFTYKVTFELELGKALKGQPGWEGRQEPEHRCGGFLAFYRELSIDKAGDVGAGLCMNLNGTLRNWYC